MNLSNVPVGLLGAKLEDSRMLIAMGCYEGVRVQSITSCIEDTSTTLKLFSLANGFPFRPAGELIQLSSDNLTDSYPSGVGVRKVFVTGLDLTWNPISEVIDMNGQAGVSGVNTYRMITTVTPVEYGSANAAWHKIYVTKAGSSLTLGVPDSNLTTLHVNDAGDNVTAIIAVPAGYTGFFLGGSVNSFGADHTVTLTRYNSSDSRTTMAKIKCPIGKMSISPEFPSAISEKTAIEFTIKAAAGTGQASIYVTMVLMDNKLFN